MTIKVRHTVYWLLVVIGFVPVVIVSGASKVFDLLEAAYAEAHRWAYQERCIPRERVPAPGLSENWRS